MRTFLTVLILTVATQVEAECGKLCDWDWWETATKKDVEFELGSSMQPLARNEDGETQLHFFAYFGNPIHIEALLKAGADIMAKDKSGFTPLHQVNNPENVSILIKAGADILAQDMDGLTPLHAAAGDPRANIEVVQALINSGANLMIKDNAGMSPLHLAARDGHPDAIPVLLEAGADTTLQDNEGKTPWNYALSRALK